MVGLSLLFLALMLAVLGCLFWEARCLSYRIAEFEKKEWPTPNTSGYYKEMIEGHVAFALSTVSFGAAFLIVAFVVAS